MAIITTTGGSGSHVKGGTSVAITLFTTPNVVDALFIVKLKTFTPTSGAVKTDEDIKLVVGPNTPVLAFDDATGDVVIWHWVQMVITT